MSGQPWGRTGRVAIHHHTAWDSADYDVIVDGRVEGDLWRIVEGPDRGGWFGQIAGFEWVDGPTLPTLGAAVMWVLRRTRPDVWRAERGPVARVERCLVFAPGRWHAYTPGGVRLPLRGPCYASQAEAMTAAASAVTR